MSLLSSKFSLSGGLCEPSSRFVLCRVAWVTGFCIGPFGGNERTWKPFNPILGETFELDLPENGVRFLAEQVMCILHDVILLLI